MHYAIALLDAAQRKGYDTELLLDAAGLSASVASKPHLRMTADQFSQLLLQFWEQADDEFFGMAKNSCRHGTFTMMSKQAVFLTDLRAVYQHIERFYRLLNPSLSMTLETSEKTAAFRIEREQPEYDPHQMLIEFYLMLMHRFPSWLIGKSIKLKWVEVSYAKPVHIAEYRLIFNCPVKFNRGANRFIFSHSWLDQPVIQTAASLRKHLRDAPLNWLTRQSFSPQYTRKVLNILSKATPLSDSRIDNVANQLHMTSRTLRRKLTQEGTSFQELKDRLRRDYAIHRLSHQGQQISDISQTLGFADPAAFSRAFKSWSGLSPSYYGAD
jgi:AraC-like DNA-binding protein